MSVNTDSTLVVYTGNESAVTPYPVPFRVLEAGDVVVGIRSQFGLLGDVYPVFERLSAGQFTVTLNAETGLAAVTTATAWDPDTEVGIWREVPPTQEREYPDSGPFPAKSHEQALDKLTMLVQELAARLDRCLELRLDTTQTDPPFLPAPIYGLVGFDADPKGTIYAFSALDGLIKPERLTINESEANPTEEDIADGQAAVWNTTGSTFDPMSGLNILGGVRLWANVGGTLVSTPLT